MMHTPKSRKPARRDKKSTHVPASARPELTAAEIESLTSRFDAARWDATADADGAAEEGAGQKAMRRKMIAVARILELRDAAAQPNHKSKKRAAHA